MTIIRRIDGQSCGCDARPSKALISIDEALDRIMRKTRSINETENVPLADTEGRVLADPVRALDMVPPFANAAMDGYAVNTRDLIDDGGPWDLAVAGRIAAGQAEPVLLTKDTAVEVFTGAPIPEGANAVVAQEDVLRSSTSIRLDSKIAPGRHIRSAGEDMKKGKIVVPSDRCLTTREIAACAAAGHGSLRVRRRLKVALIVTGDEVCPPGHMRKAAGVWDVNTPMLCAALHRPFVDLCNVQIAADTRDGLKAQLALVSDHVDLIVTTGGISVGEEDHVKPALRDLNATIVFSGVAIKPGKPISFGHVGKSTWLGLPGNPLSALVTWTIFGTPLCQALTGQVGNPCNRRNVTLSEPLHHKPGRCELRPGRLVGLDHLGREVAVPADATHSGRVATLPAMDGLLFVPADTEVLPEGALVEFLHF